MEGERSRSRHQRILTLSIEWCQGDSYEAARFSGTGHGCKSRIGRALAQARLVPIALRLAGCCYGWGSLWSSSSCCEWSHSIITSTGGTAFPVQAELDTLKGVYALYDALDAAYLQVMVIAIPTSKKAPWQAWWKCLLFRTALCGSCLPVCSKRTGRGARDQGKFVFRREKLEWFGQTSWRLEMEANLIDHFKRFGIFGQLRVGAIHYG